MIDRNEFVADIFIKPARSINFITLNFIATRTGISFSEVGGVIMAQIDDFKTELAGGGYRPNQFRITITPPWNCVIGLDVRKTSILCKGATLPPITIGEITLAYRGRQIKVVGDRDTTGTWETEFYMDTDLQFKMHTKMVIMVSTILTQI